MRSREGVYESLSHWQYRVWSNQPHKALERIRQHQMAAKLAFVAGGIGVFAQIFGKAPLETGFNMIQTDWQLYAKAAANFPSILLRPIYIEAGVLVTSGAGLTPQEKAFWTCLLASSPTR